MAFLALQFVKKLAAPGGLTRLRTWLERWRHWEFWPAWMFYPPVAIYCFWLAIKYRGLTLPTTANPRIFSAGVVGESKMAILQTLMETSLGFTGNSCSLSAQPIAGMAQRPPGSPRCGKNGVNTVATRRLILPTSSPVGRNNGRAPTVPLHVKTGALAEPQGIAYTHRNVHQARLFDDVRRKKYRARSDSLNGLKSN